MSQVQLQICAVPQRPNAPSTSYDVWLIFYFYFTDALPFCAYMPCIQASYVMLCIHVCSSTFLNREIITERTVLENVSQDCLCGTLYSLHKCTYH